MWPFKRKEPELWEMIPNLPQDDKLRKGTLTPAQRDFCKRQIEANPYVSKRVKRDSLERVARAEAAGHQFYADTYLSLSLSLEGYNMRRIVRDLAYWEEYRKVMLGGLPISRLDWFLYTPGRSK